MNASARHVQKVYLVLLLLHTLAASFIWGIIADENDSLDWLFQFGGDPE